MTVSDMLGTMKSDSANEVSENQINRLIGEDQIDKEASINLTNEDSIEAEVKPETDATMGEHAGDMDTDKFPTLNEECSKTINIKLTTIKSTNKSVFGEIKYLPFEIENFQGTMMLDTGSAGNYISEQFYDHLRQNNRHSLQYDDVTYEETIVLGDSRTIKSHGRIGLIIMVEEHPYLVDFVVLADLCDVGILGVPFMDTYVDRMDMRRGEISLLKTSLVTLEGKVCVEPLTQATVRGYVPGMEEGRHDAILIQVMSHINTKIMIPNSLIKVIQGRTQLQLSNFTPQDIYLKTGTVLGICLFLHEDVLILPMAKRQKLGFCHMTTDTNGNHKETFEPVDWDALSEMDKKFLEEFDFTDTTLTSREKNQVCQVLLKHKSIFVCDEYPDLGCTDLLTYHIKLKEGSKPFTSRAYRLDPQKMATLREQLNKLLTDDVIEPAESPYSSPVILVRKPPEVDEAGNVISTKWRCCLDFRRLNQDIVPDAYNLPDIRALQDHIGMLSNPKLLTKVDMDRAFWQIALDDESKPCTAFTTPFGNFVCKRLPMGLSVSPAVFSRLMNLVLAGMDPFEVMCYIDDLLIVSTTIERHLQVLEEVFMRLQKAKLKLKPAKCSIGKKEVPYLGFVVSQDGVRISRGKIEIITELPPPKTRKELRRAMGMMNYLRRFIPQFSAVAKPLYMLLKEAVPYIWGKEQHEAWEELKKRITTPPILAYPRIGWLYRLHTDAAKTGTAYMLTQIQPEDDWKEEHPDEKSVPTERSRERPIAYGSAGMKSYQLNYTATEMEMLAVVRGVQQNECYLRPPARFEVVTDHQPLATMLKMKEPSSRLARWIAYLQEFIFQVVYREGSDNVVPDCLSRLENQPEPPPTPPIEDVYFPYTLEQVVQVTEKSPKPVSVMAAILPRATNVVAAAKRLRKRKHQRRVKPKKRAKQVDEDVVLPDARRMMETGDTIQTVVTVLGVEVSEFLKAQEEDDKYGPIVHFLRDEKLPQEEEEAKYVLMMSPLFEMYNDLLFLNRKTKNPRPDEVLPLLKLVIPRKYEELIIQKYHSGMTAGHVSTSKMYEQIRDKMYIKNLFQKCDIVRKACEMCQPFREGTRTGPLKVPRVVPPHPFHTLQCDHLGPIKTSYTGKTHVLVITCEFSKFVYVKAVENPDSIQTAEVLVNDVIPYFGVPRVIHSDRGPAFTAKIVTKMCEMLHVKQTYAPPSHHQSMGQVERSVRTVRELMDPLIREYGQDWEQILPGVAMVINTCPHTVTKLSPFTIVFGRLPYHPDEELLEEVNVEENNPEAQIYLERLKKNLKVISQAVQKRITQYHLKVYGPDRVSVSKIPYLQIGEQVWVRDHSAIVKGEDKYIGPLEIVEHKGDTIVRLRWPGSGRDYVPRDVHIEHLKPMVGRPLREVLERPEEMEMPVDALDEEATDVEMVEEVETEDVTGIVDQKTKESSPEDKPEVENAAEDKPEVETTTEVRRRSKRQRKTPEYYGVNKEPQETDDSDAQEDKDTQEYRVKRILAKRRGPRNRWEYKVQFTGYSPKEAIWLSGSCLNKKALIAADQAPEVDKRENPGE